MQPDGPVPWYPGAQTHAALDVLVVNVVLLPDGHESHPPSLMTLLYLPTTQAEHATVPVPEYPGAHLHAVTSRAPSTAVVECGTWQA